MEILSPAEGPYVVSDGKKWLDFSSQDYLGLAQHPEVKKGAIKYTLKYGTHIFPSYALSLPQKEIEVKLAHFLKKEKAFLFPSFSEIQYQLKTYYENSSKKSKEPKMVDLSSRMAVSGSDGFTFAKDVASCEIFYGNLSYGVGVACAFIASSQKTLSSFSRSHVSFPILGALDCALSLIPDMESERETLESLKKTALKKWTSYSPAIQEPACIQFQTSSQEDAMMIRQKLQQQNLYLPPCQDNTLSVFLTALHTPEDIDELTSLLKSLLPSAAIR